MTAQLEAITGDGLEAPHQLRYFCGPSSTTLAGGPAGDDALLESA